MKIRYLLIALALSANATAAPATKQDAADQKRFDACQKKLQKAQKLGVLYDLQLKPIGAKVYAGQTFYDMPIDAKQGFAETVSCLLTAGKAGVCADFNIYNWKSGKHDATYASCRLTIQ